MNSVILIKRDPFDPAILQSQMKSFGQYLLVQLGLHPKTVNNFVKLIRRPMRIKWHTIHPSHDQITAWIAGLHEAKYSFHHIANSCLAIERYSQFIGRPIKLGRPRKPKRIPKETLSEAEIAVILAACKGVRERAILTVLAYSGIRNEELCNLKTRDIDIAGGVIYVIQGKGSKDRTIPVAGAAIRVVLEYLSAYPRQDDEFLFTTLRAGQRYTEWSLRRLVKRVVKRTFIPKRVHPHLFRHSLATNMLMRKAHIMTIQQQLGHSDIQTTMIYLNPKTTHLQAEYMACAPCYI